MKKFFAADDGSKKAMNPSKTVGDNFMNVQLNVEVNKDSELYKRNQARFHG